MAKLVNKIMPILLNVTFLSGCSQEGDEQIDVMKLKVLVYAIVKNVNYSFKGYLFKIGIIPEELYFKVGQDVLLFK